MNNTFSSSDFRINENGVITQPKIVTVKPFHEITNKTYFHEINHTSEDNEIYKEDYRRSIENPDEFWSEIGHQLTWFKPWDQVLDNSKPPFTKWYPGGEINACYNAIDRHVLAGRGLKIALIHDSPLTQSVRHVTYGELLEKVSHLAGALSSMGVKKGDCVLIYMPLIPEAIIAMLATVRLGAMHSVVFGGFAARELCTRIEHAEPKVIIAASCGLEPSKIIRYKEILNEAIEWSCHKPNKCIIFQRRNVECAILEPEIDIDWDKALKMASPHQCVPVEANDPLYILYTSGTTDQPKGIQRPIGGHITTLAMTLKAIYGLGPDAVWWAASDLGWVVGHSYICYAPLLYGITSVMYEGKPDRTPDPGQYFRVISEHKVNAMFTVPTAFRVIRREDPEVLYGRKYSIKSLKYIFVAGEHCDYETKVWAEKVFKVPVLNHWWQTETGHAITASAMGLGHSTNPPKHTCGLPFFGYNVKVLRNDGTEALNYELGRIVIKLPLPPGTMSTLYQAPDLFCKIYFHKYPGYYDTMDAGYIDEDGYVFVTARDDDVINVAGHRLSTSALEDVILAHPDIVDASVIGVPEITKGEIPLCLFVVKKNAIKSETSISRELVYMIREAIGPIAAFRLAVAVKALPRTRSGKTCRKSIADLARNKAIKVIRFLYSNVADFQFPYFMVFDVGKIHDTLRVHLGIFEHKFSLPDDNKISGTVEDPSVYKEILNTLNQLGFARTAPEPK